MTSMFVPGRFVRSQLFWIPGEERKFRRCRIVALVPVCKRERAVAASQAVLADGVSVPGVGAASITAVSVGVGSGVAVDATGSVAVGDGERVTERVLTSVVVVEEIELAGTASIVSVGVDRETRVDVASTAAGFVAEVAEIANDVLVVAPAKDEMPDLRRSRRKRASSRIATINLKRS